MYQQIIELSKLVPRIASLFYGVEMSAATAEGWCHDFQVIEDAECHGSKYYIISVPDVRRVLAEYKIALLVDSYRRDCRARREQDGPARRLLLILKRVSSVSVDDFYKQT